MQTPTSSALTEKLQALPDAPGVYLMKDAESRVLYVGKAKSLRARVRSYFTPRSADERVFFPFLRSKVHDVDVLVVGSEKEALLLENSLIKQHRPKYNIRLVDDKTFLSLRLDRRHAFPRFTTVRRPRADGSTYFGPYSSARAVRDTLKVIYRAFGVRSCSDAVFANRSRPCLYYQIGQCLAPCVGYVSEAEYGSALDQAELLLTGKDDELLGRLKGEMQSLAEEERFEQAARVRDRLRALERTLEGQTVARAKDVDHDVVGHASRGDDHVLVWLFVRDGHVVDSTTLRARDRGGAPRGELLSTALLQAYDSLPIPGEILLATEPSDHQALEEVLAERRGKKVSILTPERGHKRRLVELAETNALASLELASRRTASNAALLESLRELLDLPALPRRIECFDISNIQGTLAVGSMSVALDGELVPSEYRHYRIRTVEGADDYAMMREVISRRLLRALDEHSVPDLLLVDGGRGQLAIARSVAEELGAEDLPLAGIAKGKDRNAGREAIHLLDREEPLRLPHDDARLHLLQRIRDEAHRFAITYHRKLRSKRDRTSLLRQVRGIGPRRTKALLETLGSVEAVRAASLEELTRVPGMTAAAAEAVHQALHGEGETGFAIAADTDD